MGRPTTTVVGHCCQGFELGSLLVGQLAHVVLRALVAVCSILVGCRWEGAAVLAGGTAPLVICSMLPVELCRELCSQMPRLRAAALWATDLRWMFLSWRSLLGFALGFLLLSVVVLMSDPREVLVSVYRADYRLVLPAVGLYFLSLHFRAIRWSFLLVPILPVPAGRLFPLVCLGFMVNNLLPVRLGELTRALLLSRREPVSVGFSLGAVVVERAYDALMLLLLGPGAILFLLFGGHLESPGFLVRLVLPVLLLGLAVMVGLLMLGSSRHSRWLADLILRSFPRRLGRRVGRLLLSFLEGISLLESPRSHLKLFALTLPVWLMEAAAYFLIGHAFGLDELLGSPWVLIAAVLLVAGVANLAGALPATVGGIGAFELASQRALLAVGVDIPLGTAYAAFLHLVVLWAPVNLVGLFFIWRLRLSPWGVLGR